MSLSICSCNVECFFLWELSVKGVHMREGDFRQNAGKCGQIGRRGLIVCRRSQYGIVQGNFSQCVAVTELTGLPFTYIYL